MAVLFEELMAQEYPGPFAVMGHSLGACTALEMALRFPQRVLAAMMVALPPRMPVIGILGAAPLVGEAAVRLSRLAPFGPTAVGLYLRGMYSDPSRLTPGVIEAYVRTAARPHFRQGMLDGLRGLASWRGPQALRALAVPSALVWGSSDPWAQMRAARRLAALNPAVALHVLEDCGHSPPEETPERFNPLALDLLTRATSARAA